jgi:hypothetical protein
MTDGTFRVPVRAPCMEGLFEHGIASQIFREPILPKFPHLIIKKAEMGTAGWGRLIRTFSDQVLPTAE